MDQLSLVALSHPAMRIVYGANNRLKNNLSIPLMGVNRSCLPQDLFSVQPGQPHANAPAAIVRQSVRQPFKRLVRG